MYGTHSIFVLLLVALALSNEATGQILSLPVTLGGSGQASAGFHGAGSHSDFSAGSGFAAGATGGALAGQAGSSSGFAAGFGSTGLDGYVANAADLQAASLARSARAGFEGRGSSAAGVAWGQDLQRTSGSVVAGAGARASGTGGALSGAAMGAAEASGGSAGAVRGELDFASMGQMGVRLRKLSESNPQAFQAFLDSHQGLRWKLQGVRPGNRAGIDGEATARTASGAASSVLVSRPGKRATDGITAETEAFSAGQAGLASSAPGRAAGSAQSALGSRLSASALP